MPYMKIKVRVDIAWWVRPALALARLLDRVQPARTERRIEWIIDHGVRQKTLPWP